MYSFPIGVMLESFRKEPKEALDIAQSLGVQGLQVYVTFGAMQYNKNTPAQRKEFLKMVKDHGLTISALCGDLGHGFGDPERNPGLIQQSKEILDVAMELETNVVTTHIGVVPSDVENPRYRIMQDACGELARYADSLNAHFAIETGPETAVVLKRFLDGLHSTGVAVNLDPANLVMVTGDDPVQAVYTLKDYIVHTHAKDGRKLTHEDSEVIYGLKPRKEKKDEEGNIIVNSPAFIELPLGQGDVPFPRYLQALTEIGYKGFLTIEREAGEDPTADIREAVSFLRKNIQG